MIWRTLPSSPGNVIGQTLVLVPRGEETKRWVDINTVLDVPTMVMIQRRLRLRLLWVDTHTRPRRNGPATDYVRLHASLGDHERSDPDFVSHDHISLRRP